MGDFRRGGFGGRSGGGRFGGRSGGFRGRDSDRKPRMHDVVCGKCGKECQVPFKPTGDKPVLCSDCFRASGNARDSPRGGSMSSQSGISSEQFNQLNAKLDRILKVLQDLEIDTSDDEPEEVLDDDLEEDSDQDIVEDSEENK